MTVDPEADVVDEPGSRHSALRRVGWVLIGVVLVAFAVALWGGYTQGWEWTGVTDKDTLWHWMQVLMVPIAFASLPIVLRSHQSIRPERKALMVGLTVAFVAFVIVGYAVPLEWTGFTGNTLWDWMSLLLLPIAITSVRFIYTERSFTAVHWAIVGVVVAGFGVLIAFGYVAPWDWTGFTGNTLLDWVQLLILPLLFPTVVVPAAAKWLTKTREEQPAAS